MKYLPLKLAGVPSNEFMKNERANGERRPRESLKKLT